MKYNKKKMIFFTRIMSQMMSNLYTSDNIEKMKIEIKCLLSLEASNHFPFSLERIYMWLDEIEEYKKYSNNDIYRKYFYDNILNNSHYLLEESTSQDDISKDFIMSTNTLGIEYPYFTSCGFKAFCIVLDSNKSKYLLKYYNQVECAYYKNIKSSHKSGRSDNSDGIIEYYSKELDKARVARDRSSFALTQSQNALTQLQTALTQSQNALTQSQNALAQLQTTLAQSRTDYKMLYDVYHDLCNQYNIIHDENRSIIHQLQQIVFNCNPLNNRES
jgi:hypothetical protein